MNEIEFSKIVMQRYDNSDDLMLNIIIKLIEENNIEVENAGNYITGGIKEILEEESLKLNLLNVDKVQVFDIFS